MRREERNTYIEKCLTLIKLSLQHESDIPKDLINRLSRALESLSENQEIKVLIETEDNDWTGFEDYKYLYEDIEKNNKKESKKRKNVENLIPFCKVCHIGADIFEPKMDNKSFEENKMFYENLLKSHYDQLNCKKQNYIEINPNNNYVVETNLKELLAKKNLSQVDVAKQMNVSVKTLNNIVAQKANTSIEVALKLSHILQEPIENIFSLSEKMELVEK